MSEKMEIQGAKPNLPKLAKSGRIKLTATGDVVGQAKNDVLFVDKKPIKVQDVVVGYKEIAVYGGHAKNEGSVWRVALGGPRKYHEKVLKDNRRKETVGDIGFRPSAPELDFDTPEFNEYQEYKKFLAEKGVEIADDAEFYAWKNGEKKSVGRPKKTVEETI